MNLFVTEALSLVLYFIQLNCELKLKLGEAAKCDASTGTSNPLIFRLKKGKKTLQ